jgi:hypothetical protein
MVAYLEMAGCNREMSLALSQTTILNIHRKEFVKACRCNKHFPFYFFLPPTINSGIGYIINN